MEQTKISHNARPCGKQECYISTGIHGGLTFESGELDRNGFWEKPCSICARYNEEHYPEDGECWPFKKSKEDKV